MNVGKEMIRVWKDIPLDQHGKEQANEVAKSLRKLGNVGHIYSSDLIRAAYTADRIKDELGAPLEMLKSLRPWDVGSLAGVPLDADVRKKLAELTRDSSKKAPNGESFSAFVHRLKGAIDKITHAAMLSELPIIVVTHTRDIRIFLVWIESGMSGIFRQPSSKWIAKDEDPVKPGQYIELNWKRGRWTAGEAKSG